MKNYNDTIGNRTRDLPACSAVPQPTASPRAFFQIKYTETITKLERCVYHLDTELHHYIILCRRAARVLPFKFRDTKAV